MLPRARGRYVQLDADACLSPHGPREIWTRRSDHRAPDRLKACAAWTACLRGRGRLLTSWNLLCTYGSQRRNSIRTRRLRSLSMFSGVSGNRNQLRPNGVPRPCLEPVQHPVADNPRMREVEAAPESISATIGMQPRQIDVLVRHAPLGFWRDTARWQERNFPGRILLRPQNSQGSS